MAVSDYVNQVMFQGHMGEAVDSNDTNGWATDKNFTLSDRAFVAVGMPFKGRERSDQDTYNCKHIELANHGQLSRGGDSMKFNARRFSILCFLTIGLSGMAQDCGVCTKNGIDMPISLAAGVVRTPEFSAKRGFYNVDIEVKWLLPTDQLRCEMGFAASPSDNHCSWKPLLDLRWKVLTGSDVVAEGIDSGRSTSFEADKYTLSRSVGSFKAAAHHKYVVELTFLKDASVLNVAQPRLTVEQPGFSF
ncbi:MAG TPA: hypothetical protein VFW25_11360 [Silvibacterium sp.]|nr:hypothetical protein [Silvibacterium sp.]